MMMMMHRRAHFYPGLLARDVGGGGFLPLVPTLAPSSSVRSVYSKRSCFPRLQLSRQVFHSSFAMRRIVCRICYHCPGFRYCYPPSHDFFDRARDVAVARYGMMITHCCCLLAPLLFLRGFQYGCGDFWMQYKIVGTDYNVMYSDKTSILSHC